MNSVSEIFGSMVFNEKTMKERLPKEVFKSLKKTIQSGSALDVELANVIANAMKDWAIEKGATHFTHWFQPMTGITAEKHDSFISDVSDGTIIMEFSGSALVKGEPDASSFPSGGLRSTFEARGYTAWDPTSYVFIKDGTLCIPTAFCSYSGEALDKKTPLLRSNNALNKQALRVLALFGQTDAKRVTSTVGPEQEYFLINKEHFRMRKDLVYCGRTLFGAAPPKGQELEDHYFGIIKPRVSGFMKELNNELWKLGILAKTQHNEVAPSQHELAPIFASTNVACDHNQLTMEMMKKVASNHDLVCLLHEKPFAGINGSGKHNNWSMGTDTGVNLLDPGDNPQENAQFLLFLCAVLKAVDDHQDLLRLSVASAGNDHRLGAAEAPPAIVSAFLGEDLTNILDCIENGKPVVRESSKKMTIGVDVLPAFPKDTTDRNRTSPFAFTGNKFEFRMLGAELSVSGPNIVLNTIVADALSEFADELEKAADFTKALNDLIKKTIKKHRRIIFNGNNYAEEWVKEAKKRGLLNLKSTPEAFPVFTEKKNVALFEKHEVFSKGEVHARSEILIENYCKTINIEALTMLDMVKKDIIPATSSYVKELADTAAAKKALAKEISCEVEKNLVTKLSTLSASVLKNVQKLEKELAAAEKQKTPQATSVYFHDVVLKTMTALRADADEIESLVGEKYWPYPTYGKLLFSV